MGRNQPRVVPEVSQRDDASTYQRLYRQRRPASAERNRQRAVAYSAAARRVAKAHPREFAKAFAEELAKRGVS
jgi:hypothetical protein